MSEFRPFVVAMVVVVIFSLVSFMFVYGYITQNNPNSAFLSDSSLNKTMIKINNTMTKLNDANNEAMTLISSNEGIKPSPLYVFLIVPAALSIPLSYMSFLYSGIDAVGSLAFTQVFGSSNPIITVFATLIGILVLTAILLLIQYIRTGRSG